MKNYYGFRVLPLVFLALVPLLLYVACGNPLGPQIANEVKEEMEEPKATIVYITDLVLCLQYPPNQTSYVPGEITPALGPEATEYTVYYDKDATLGNLFMFGLSSTIAGLEFSSDQSYWEKAGTSAIRMGAYDVYMLSNGNTLFLKTTSSDGSQQIFSFTFEPH